MSESPCGKCGHPRFIHTRDYGAGKLGCTDKLGNEHDECKCYHWVPVVPVLKIPPSNEQ